jgi:cytochrome b subunit of formate dehydrogenase
MNKNKVKLYVDILMFLDFLILATSGFILKWIYPAGEKSGKAGVIFLFDRFAWLKIHNITSIIIVLLILIHLYLNWNWIKCMFVNACKNLENGQE